MKTLIVTLTILILSVVVRMKVMHDIKKECHENPLIYSVLFGRG
jgi:hypothetical protein